ncbi:hypothetical protein [Umezawaea sp. NPDC059074]|uniref:hypothetical protein n=1 Tax=Umezawaea sp. NPDC059074 TaxID=3346716 RepID=UPI00367B87B8
MGQYELTFTVEPIENNVIEDISSKYDALYSAHGESHFLTITYEAESGATAAKQAVARLESRYNVVVKQFREDFVTRGDIADRIDATPQAVGQWIRGDRQKQQPFPPSYSNVAGGIWLWGEVNEWLRLVGKEADDLLFVNREEITEVNRWLNIRKFIQPIQITQPRLKIYAGHAWPGKPTEDTLVVSERIPTHAKGKIGPRNWLASDFEVVG